VSALLHQSPIRIKDAERLLWAATPVSPFSEPEDRQCHTMSN
jgi:hypothetical protein